MAMHKDFPKSPHAILNPEVRWFPADETLRDSAPLLMPPLVTDLRQRVKAWRDSGYEGASTTSAALLNWWFAQEHLQPKYDGSLVQFQYYFAQREAVETVIYLYEVAKVKDQYDMMRFDLSGRLKSSLFDESWRRFVVKMATGSGKTKVMSLILTWCYFHKLYEPNSELARNFLVIAPNIIVLDRIRTDFDGLRIFYHDPVLPDNGFEGQNWRDDFHLRLHIQDEVRIIQRTGNIFLTNIHRVYASKEVEPSIDDENTMDYFLGKRPTGKTTDSGIDLGDIVREIDELVVLNDEAHHIHDSKLAWFKSIEDIHHRLLHKERFLSLQVDVSATPKHNNGAIFVQTVSDYPLVEAITQNVTKHPVLPDAPSRAKLEERQSSIFTERYGDYIQLGVEEWRKVYAEHKKLNKKAILFIMTDDTKNCDEVAEFLENTYPEFKNAVLTIHTKSNGEISEASNNKAKEELEKLRKQSNQIDSWESPFKAIVSVLMLKEGWDVKNVTTIVGLRAYSAKSNILPEQTLGRGLRRMYPGEDVVEYVSVVGTDAFMEFVEQIQNEGVELERKAMGEGTKPNAPLVVEVDNENLDKDLNRLDIEIPVLTPRIYRNYKNLKLLNPANFGHQKVAYQQFEESEKREIVFKDITSGEINHTTELAKVGIADFRSAVGYFAQTIMHDLRLVGGYDILYGKVKDFIMNHLFNHPIDLEDMNTLRNLSELAATKTTMETFKKEINLLTVEEHGTTEIKDYIKLRKTRPFVVKDQGYVVPKKSVFNKIIGDGHLELDFAYFLDQCEDVVSFSKNFMAVNFRLDYVKDDGSISNYYPDFFVKLAGEKVVIVETKGQEDLDVPHKMNRLKQWCVDINQAQEKLNFDFVFVDEGSFREYKPKNFKQLMDGFLQYKK